jgi:MSHA biogenesis protein MshL
MKKHYFILLAFIFLAFGCATPKMVQIPETMVLKEPPKFEIPKVKPQPPKETELPPLKEQGHFSLNVRDVDIRDIFLLLSKDSGVNIIADQNVTGKISIDFTNLDLYSALYAITKQLGLTFTMDKGFIRVSKPHLETRTFQFNYIVGKRSSYSTMNAAISQSTNTGAMNAGGSTINISTTPSAGQTAGLGTSGTAQGNVYVTTSGTSDLWKEIRKGLEVIIFGDSKGGSEGVEGSYSRGDNSGRKLVISESAGIIQVTDSSDKLENVKDFLDDVEKSIRKEVLIQAHIIEVTLNDTYKLGINWELVFKNSMESFSVSQNLMTQPPTGVFVLDYEQNKPLRNITAMIDAMKEQGQVRVLSSPKVATMNNQKAIVKLTTKEVSWVTNSYLNAQGEVLLTYTNPEIDEVGLFLDVIPQIDENGLITMQIHPSISDILGNSVSPDGKSTKPIIDVREVDSMVTVKNGQTILIAGLITEKTSDTTTSVPILGDIPFLGKLFRRVSQEKSKTELVILLTPYILTDQSIEDIRKEQQERLKNTERPFEPVPSLNPSH